MKGGVYRMLTLELRFHQIVTMALSGCNHSSGDPQSDSHQAVVSILFVGGRYSAGPVSGCCVPVFPPFPSV